MHDCFAGVLDAAALNKMVLQCNKDLFGAKVFGFTTRNHRDIMDGESEAEVASLRHFDVVKINQSTHLRKDTATTAATNKANFNLDEWQET